MGLARGLSAFLLVIGSTAASSRLDVVDLPVGFFPEGITNGDEWIAYVGSLVDGSIWKGDLSTGEGEVVVSGANSMSVGLDHDRRSGYLYVAGGPAGEVRVYDDETWDLVVTYNVSVGESTFLNDIIVTKTAAYITDSFQAQLYMIPLNRDDGEFVDPDEPATVIPLDGFPVVEGEFNANGIASTRDGSMLIIANLQAGTLHKFDPETNAVTAIDLGGEAVHGDGLVLRENTLWVIENGAFSDMQIREISLSADFTCGFVSPVILKSDLFDSPTTAMRKGNSLYVVQAKFSVPEEDIATTPYEIVRVDRDEGEYNCSAR